MYVHITEHASFYTGLYEDSRTSLVSSEIVSLIKSGSFVRFGESRGTRFDLIWDHYREAPIILLTRNEKHASKIVVVSVWKSDYVLPVDPPSKEQIDSARIKSEEFWSRMTL